MLSEYEKRRDYFARRMRECEDAGDIQGASRFKAAVDQPFCFLMPDEQLKHEPPPCERPFQRGEIHKHPRYPSGDCVNCGAMCTEGCKHELFESWEQEQTGHEAS